MTVLIDIIGIGIIIPVFPTLIRELAGSTLSEASIYGGFLIFVYAFFQFLFSPILGGLSDQFGRRPVLLLSLFGLGVDYLFLVFAPTIAWLIIGRIIAGICGASITTANAYVADISGPEDGAKNFGMIGAAFGLGFIVGPTIGGFLAEIGTRIPFLVAAIFTLINWLYGFFMVPESLKPEYRRPFSIKRANPVGTILQLRRYSIIIGLIVCMLVVCIAAHATQTTWTYFTMEKFDWSEYQVGLSLGFVGIMIAIVQAGLVGYIVTRIGQAKALYVGLIFNVLGLALISISSQSWMLYVLIVPYSLGGLVSPSLQGIMVSQVPANEQGELQGGLTSMVSLASIIGPLVMSYIFFYFTSPKHGIYFPGAPFVLGTFLALVSLGLAYRSLSKFS